jgi:hypothetical protein
MTTVAQPRSLRGEIENVLARKIDGVPVAGTLTWLTTELGGAGVAAKARVALELKALEREGKVTTRRLRSGETLWKLTDQHHAQWQHLAGGSLRRGN